MASSWRACMAGSKRNGCSPEGSARRAVDRYDAPAMPHAGAVDMIDARDRAVFHRERETRFRLQPERQPERGADRAAMRHRDDVAAAIGVENAMDRARDPLHHVDEALAAGGALMRRRVPESVERTAARMAQLVIGQALPVAETLFAKLRYRGRFGAGYLGWPGQAGADDRPCRFMRAAQ